jgi:ribokinase
MFGNSRLDFLAVGDITTDAFIRLKDAHVHTNPDEANAELCVRFGDKIPYESVTVVRAVGNSPNAAVSAARLGLSSGLVADIGDDQNGKECLAVLRSEKVNTGTVTVHKNLPTNYHYVLWYGADRTILVKHQNYSYRFPEIKKPPRWLYLSSLGPATEKYHEEIEEYLKKNPEVKLAFQPGTFQINLGAERLKGIYRRTAVFICNKEEAQKILGSAEADVKKLQSGIQALGPDIVLITDGPKGAYMLSSDSYWFMPPYPDPKPPLNRTGAGDAYASTLVSAIILGKKPEEAIRWAPINSMSVIQQIGAQKGLLKQAALESFLAGAPADYKPKKI